MEDNMGHIFLEKSYTKCAGENIPRLFSEKSKFIVSLDQKSHNIKTIKTIIIIKANLETTCAYFT